MNNFENEFKTVKITTSNTILTPPSIISYSHNLPK